MPGIYTPDAEIELNSSGVPGHFIVYRAVENDPVIINGNNQTNFMLQIKGDFICVDGIEFEFAGDNAIEILGNFNTVSNCYVHHAGQESMRMVGSNNLQTCRAFNNIIALNDSGIDGAAENVCGFNNVWGNIESDYSGGVADSAGGISAEPGFINPDSGDFNLVEGALEIDAGLDLGYPFYGDAPDMGAKESNYNGGIAYIEVIPANPAIVEEMTQRFSVFGYDADSTFLIALTDSVTWSTTDPSGSIDSSGLYTAGYDISPPSYLVYAVYGSLRDSSEINVATNGLLHHVHIEYNDGTEFTDTTLTTDDDDTRLYCRAYDSGDNLWGDAPATWTVIGLDSIGAATPATGLSTTLILSRPGTGKVIASVSPTVKDTSGIITCLVGAPATLVISPDTASVSADSTLAFTAQSYDADGNPRPVAVTADWSVVGGIGAIATNGLFTPESAGTGRMAAAFEGSADTTDLITVVAGQLEVIEIAPDSVVVSSDSTYQFNVFGYDAKGNATAAGTITWGLSAPLGSIDTTGLFDAISVGIGKVTASSDLGPVDTTSWLEVVPGDLTSLSISPDRDTVSADSTRMFVATGMDSDGNSVTELGDLIWAVSGDIGTIDLSGLFTAIHAGVGFVGVTSNLGPTAITDTILVEPGTLACLDVIPDADLVVEETSYQFTALGYDADSNLIDDYTTSAPWTTTDPSGSVSGTGLYTAGTDLSPPKYYVIGSVGEYGDSSEVTVISNGSLSRIRIELFDGTPVGDTILTTDADTTRLYCRGYSSSDNLIGDLSVQWSIIGGDPIGTVNPGIGTWTRLALSTTGTCRIVGVYSAGVKDTTGLITCKSGVPAAVVVSPEEATIDADSTLQFTLATFDADGNSCDPIADTSWSVLNGIGTISLGGLFTPGSAGTGFIVLNGGGLADTTGPVTVLPGELVAIDIAPDVAIIAADSVHQFEIRGYDSKGNACDTGNIAWGLTAPLGSIDTDGIFEAATVGYGRVVAVSSRGPVDTTTSLEVVPGRLANLAISPDSVEITADMTALFSAVGTDADGNLADRGSLAWMVVGDYGIIDLTGLFTPDKTGLAQIVVSSSFDNVSDTNRAVVIQSGILNRLVIEPNTASLAVNDTVNFVTSGFDAKSNATDAGILNWEVIGGIGAIDADGMFVATTTGAGNVAVISSINNVVDTTDLIVVTSGELSDLEIIPDFAVISADSTKQFTVIGYDTYGNPRDPGTITWGLTSPIGTIDGAGLFDPETAGQTHITVVSALGYADTSSIIEVVPGRLVNLAIEPDSTRVMMGSPFTFTAEGKDADGNDAAMGTLLWEVIGDIGDIDAAGIFTPLAVGMGRIATTSSIDGISDTNRMVQTYESPLEYIVVSPDTASLNLNDGITFVATGYNNEFNPVDVGVLTWEVLGGIGAIDTNGVFVATAIGAGEIKATSSINNISDITDMIVVEVPTVTEIALGNAFVAARQTSSPILAFRLTNVFDSPKGIQGMTLRNSSKGAGSVAEITSNFDRVAFYLDNNNAIWDPADSLITATGTIVETMELAFSPLTIGPGSARLFFITVDIAPYPRDGDSLDIFFLPATDIHMTDGGVVAGADIVNSLGYNIIDGLIAEEVTIVQLDDQTVSPDDPWFNALTVDIPRNGYDPDYLNILTVYNMGTATPEDFDSLILFRDNGDGIWNGREEEVRLGELLFTGGMWEISGMEEPLSDQTTRYHVAVKLAEYPTNNATLALGVPLHGLEMASANDGPLDTAIPPENLITIQSFEALRISSVPIPVHTLIPGQMTGPLLGIQFANGCADAVSLDRLHCTVFAVDGAGASQADLDSQIDSLLLYANLDGDFEVLGIEDTLIAGALVQDGIVDFDLGGFTVPNAGSVAGFSVTAHLSLRNARNDNVVNIGIAEPADVIPVSSITMAGDFPIKNTDDFRIDAFPTAAVTIYPIESVNIFEGEQDQAVLDFALPRNGYAPDFLNSLALENVGTLPASDEYLEVKLWADRDEDGFTPDDLLLGALRESGGAWIVSGLAAPLTAVSTRFAVTARISDDLFKGGTLAFEIPQEGASYQSGTTGPDDAAVGNPEAHLVFPTNRITAISIPFPSTTILPGQDGNVVLSFALYNGYIGQGKILQAVTLTNSSRTRSTAAFADSELGHISLYYDADNNRALDGDSLIAAGYCAGGKLLLAGMDIGLASESLSYFFVVADGSRSMIDADSLAVTIAGASDLVFSEPVNINGDLPLGGGYLIVDGSAVSQYDIVELEPTTVSPGDTSIVLFAFRPAMNGDQPDILQSITVRNMLDADQTDIATLGLWLDVDDDQQRTGNDSFLGPLSYFAGEWTIAGLAVEIAESSPTLFVVADFADGARPDAAFQAMIPANGCQYSSANDGPRNGPLSAANTFTITDSRLRVSCRQLRDAYSVGQDIDVALTVTNLLPTPVDSVVTRIVDIDDESLVALVDSSALQPRELAAGTAEDFTLRYTAEQPGSITWRFRAVAQTTSDSTSVVNIGPVLIQTPPENVNVNLINSIPTAVIRGQINVFPLTVTFSHPDSDPMFAPIRLDSIRISVEDGAGAGIDADKVFSRLVLAAGYQNLHILEDIPAAPSVSLAFLEPLVAYPGQTKSLSLLVDIADQVDDNTSLAVPLDAGVAFPLRTATCRIDDAAERMAVSYVARPLETVNYGQRNVQPLDLLLRHPGLPGSSPIQLTGLSFCIRDIAGVPIEVSSLFDEVKIQRQQIVVADVDQFDAGTSEVNFQLSSPVTLNPGERDSVQILVSVKEWSSIAGFSLQIADSTSFVVRDLSSGGLLVAISDSWAAGENSIFPINSGWLELRRQAVAPDICILPELPEAIVGGPDALPLFELSLDYTAGAEYSSIVMHTILVQTYDSLGRLLEPDRLFDRIGYRLENGPVVYQPYVQVLNGASEFQLGDDGLRIDPGETRLIQLVADIEADAPYECFMLAIDNSDAMMIHDASDVTFQPGMALSAECGADFPVATSLTRILMPAGSPRLAIEPLPVRIAAPGQQGITVLKGNLTYRPSTAQGDILLRAIHGTIHERSSTGSRPLAGSTVFDGIDFLINQMPVAGATDLSGENFALLFDQEYTVVQGDSLDIALVCNISDEAPPGNCVFRFADSSFMELADKDLSTAVHPLLVETDYPISSAEISITGPTLAGSFSNFPNPFNASTGETKIAFVLNEDAHIDIEIFTITGEAVTVIAGNAPRNAGSYQTDVWSGLNDTGNEVVPGTYFCRITARYQSGRVETHRRKIAVIR